ncbi:hypothetical protein KKG90_07090, partial [Candidatus Bipolaricaulota bacterium]|nr:hypothetical protein [Candidatus Bipolaricaulota bacterium]
QRLDSMSPITALRLLVRWSSSVRSRWEKSINTVVTTKEGGRGTGRIVGVETSGRGFGVLVDYSENGIHAVCPTAFDEVHATARLSHNLKRAIIESGFDIQQSGNPEQQERRHESAYEQVIYCANLTCRNEFRWEIREQEGSYFEAQCPFCDHVGRYHLDEGRASRMRRWR